MLKRKQKEPRYIKKEYKNELFTYMKCSNYPGSNFVTNYNCPMWLLYNGEFDECGFEIDHIDEHSITGNNELENLQLLCIPCHKVKTKIFMKNKCKFTSTEIREGACLMDICKESGKKRKVF
jgi:hypothetical protein